MSERQAKLERQIQREMAEREIKSGMTLVNYGAAALDGKMRGLADLATKMNQRGAVRNAQGAKLPVDTIFALLAAGIVVHTVGEVVVAEDAKESPLACRIAASLGLKVQAPAGEVETPAETPPEEPNPVRNDADMALRAEKLAREHGIILP